MKFVDGVMLEYEIDARNPLPGMVTSFASMRKTLGALKRWKHETSAAGPDYCRMESSGRGAAWLARLLGVQEVASSNLAGPTSQIRGLYANNGGRPQTKTDQPHNTLTLIL